jgi:hypothetical protein
MNTDERPLLIMALGFKPCVYLCSSVVPLGFR